MRNSACRSPDFVRKQLEKMNWDGKAVLADGEKEEQTTTTSTSTSSNDGDEDAKYEFKKPESSTEETAEAAN